MLAYRGAAVTPHDLILAPPHDLVTQSHGATQMLHGTVNADGDGLLWYAADRDAAGELTSADVGIHLHGRPPWADATLPRLASSLRTGCLLAHVRNGTDALTAGPASQQPFTSGRVALMHNGFVGGFRHGFMRRWRGLLSDELYASLRGSSDSETLWALLIDRLDGAVPPPIARPVADTELSEGGTSRPAEAAAWAPVAGLGEALADLVRWTLTECAVVGAHAELNIVVTDGHTLAASRVASDGPGATLYVAHGHPSAPRGTIVASEPFDEDAAWAPVPFGHILKVRGEAPPTLSPL